MLSLRNKKVFFKLASKPILLCNIVSISDILCALTYYAEIKKTASFHQLHSIYSDVLQFQDVYVNLYFFSRDVFPVGVMFSYHVCWYSGPADQKLPKVLSNCNAWWFFMGNR